METPLALPAAITQHRLKLALRFIVFAVLTAAAVFSIVLCTAIDDPIWPLLSITFLAPIALGSFAALLASAWSLAQPATLTLTPDGLTYAAYWYARCYRWSDIDAFFVSAPSRLRSPACAFVEGTAGRRFVSFGGGWEYSPEDMVALLNEAKEQWGAPPA